ncbi:hypothetical protein BKH43_02735 [Helicobacter sp. 13S00401-1]|uniref:Sua5 YciO YrdC YwlC family protein n=1 Tax=Helicobacter sp. 13S00401-1 TaxID=1905758 RepID=UPI000BA608FD|nr:Sua5 YciO YrdC YwlC family protein [Helicobacter sp. 13S00401-1]PAF51139.1 hypothetical protein BKH43_02735 [Helicobacter sp. 13S00401-1]
MKDLVYLAQTDTTLGLLSQSEVLLNKAKDAPLTKNLLKQFSDFDKARIPKAFKFYVRRASKSSFIVKGSSFRISKDKKFNRFLKFFESGLYSSSANLHKKEFSLEFAKSVADVYVIDERGLSECRASKIYKLSASKIKRVR